MTTTFRLRLEDARPLKIAARLRWLTSPPGEAPTLVRRRPTRSSVGLEAIEGPQGPALLLVRPPRVRARINGMPAPRVALLHAGDLLSVDAGPLLEVELERGAAPTPTLLAPQALGSCPVCREPLEEGQALRTCQCGTSVHADPELDCASLVPLCTSCNQPFAVLEGEPERGVTP